LGSHQVFALEPQFPTVRVSTGGAFIKGAQDGSPWESIVSTDRSVPFGSILRTGPSFGGTLTYPDGTAITIKPHTILQVLADGLRLFRGQAWIKLVKRGKSFTCVTPSAIASVRGTSFTCEVQSLAWVFSCEHRSQFFNPCHLLSGVAGHLVTTSIGQAILANLLGKAPCGRVPVTVKVYEGRVYVVSPTLSGSIKQSWLLEPGEKVETNQGQPSSKGTLSEADYANWGLAVLPTRHPGERHPHELDTSQAAPDHLGQSADFLQTENPLQLMNESYDVK
jgi:hypothetical protein